ncbi:uncharacterized protein [Paramormyrops kingsleyae]|uniref:uncharacterized protein isoform X1 n=1 Tax=Paramormyrops kingsleyae TaxID=1676925 RepID=UPI003B97937D
MVCCAAWGCSNRSEKGVKMYGFPSDTKRRKKWLAQVRRRNFTITNDYNNKKLCQEHFHADQFVKTKKGKTRLRADAIPTIFVHRRVVKKKRAPILQCTPLLVNVKHIAVEHSYSVKGSTAFLSSSSTDALSHNSPAASLLLHPAAPSAPTVLQLPLDAVNPKLAELHHNTERLPKTQENEWIAVIHGDAWNPGPEMWISGCHSMSGKKRDDPLHPDFVPSLFSFTSTTDQTWAVNNLERHIQSQEVSEKRHVNACKELAATALLNLHQSPTSEAEVQVVEIQSPEVQTEERHNDITSLHEQIKSLSTKCQSLRDKVHKLESELKFCTLDASQFDDDKMKYFTGLPNLQTFMLLFSNVSSVHPATAEQNKPTWELLLTLMKLRLNLSEEFLGHLFGINQSTVSRIFLHWIHVMANKLQPLILWPKREDVRHSLPICFQTFFKNCVSIIDCFEVFIECPSDLKAQGQTWSIYKQNNTLKFLISITPQGTISFVSKAWGGRFTDKHLTKYSGFLEQLLPGDLVLAERDFTMEDSVDLFCAELVTPPSMRGKKRLSRKDIKSAREISVVRNHVKRVIGVLRQKYTILGSTLPVNLIRVEQNGKVEDSLIDKIVLTCCALCNLCQTVVPSD